ncbi:MAG: hypothetical protein IJM84_05815 [Bacteroidaceae bacterium]|uniref:hypothetical protein n=1 Tax=Pseudoprevotella muciniphila TaxID=2133944 RepID=UPI0018696CAF|nr:hypothetical protein [Pseudoprevotella muciniphila]MBQ7057446.1 hypothetical protein [Bacteroidaceae bacterium]
MILDILPKTLKKIIIPWTIIKTPKENHASVSTSTGFAFMWGCFFCYLSSLELYST